MFDRAESEGAAAGSDVGMCGDVNIFMMDEDASESYAPGGSAGSGSAALFSAPASPPQQPQPKAAEVMVMIADGAYRRRGLAAEAVRAMLQYAHARLGVRRFVAKISDANAASLALFTHKLGFRVARAMPHFEETHLALDVDEAGTGLGPRAEIVVAAPPPPALA